MNVFDYMKLVSLGGTRVARDSVEAVLGVGQCVAICMLIWFRIGCSCKCGVCERESMCVCSFVSVCVCVCVCFCIVAQ